MVKATIRFLILFSITAPAFSQSSLETEEKIIMDLITNSFQELLSENKKEKLQEYYTDGFLLLENGEVWDLERLEI